MPANLIGVEAYSDWNNKPLGGGSGYPFPYNTSYNSVATKNDLKHYLNIPGSKIYVTDDIDLTGESNIPIATGVTLLSYRGYEMYVGACLFTRDPNVDPLFVVTGPAVKIIGLRFGGYDLAAPDFSAPGTSCAIKSNYEVEIENCEFFGWGKGAIWIDGNPAGASPVCTGFRLF